MLLYTFSTTVLLAAPSVAQTTIAVEKCFILSLHPTVK